MKHAIQNLNAQNIFNNEKYFSSAGIIVAYIAGVSKHRYYTYTSVVSMYGLSLVRNCLFDPSEVR